MRAYWSAACRETGSLRKLVFAAMMGAVVVAVAGLFIPVGENLRVYFGYLAMALCGWVCGPVLACLTGIAADLIGFMIFPSGPFFAGYTLTAALGGLLYGLFLYRRPVTLWRLLLCKLTVNVLCNIGLNTVWSAVLFSKGYLFYLGQSIVKNIVMLPVEVALLMALLTALRPVLIRTNWVENKKTGDNGR